MRRNTLVKLSSACLMLLLSGCVANPYGAGIAFGLPSFSDISKSKHKEETPPEVRTENITMSDDEIYHHQNNLGTIFIAFKDKADISDKDRIDFIYSSSSGLTKLVIKASVISDNQGFVKIPIPNYPSRDVRYKDYYLEYAGISLSGLYNTVYFDSRSDYFKSGYTCYAGEHINKNIISLRPDIKNIATIHFTVNGIEDGKKYSCIFKNINYED